MTIGLRIKFTFTKQKLLLIKPKQKQVAVVVVYLAVTDAAFSCETMSSVSESTMTCVTLSLIWLYLSWTTHQRSRNYMHAMQRSINQSNLENTKNVINIYS